MQRCDNATMAGASDGATARAKSFATERGQSRVRGTLFFIAGAGWGGATAFAHMAAEPAQLVLVGLMIATAAVAVARGSLLTQEIPRLPVGLMLAHVAAALVSALVNDAPATAVIRYVAVGVAFTLVLVIATSHDDALPFAIGLGAAMAAFVIVHITRLEGAMVNDPLYRFKLYLNPNAMAFVAGVFAVVCIAALRSGMRRYRVAILALLTISVVLCYSAKSRTATLAMIAGIAAAAMVGVPLRRKISGAVVAIFVVSAVASVGSSAIDDALLRLSDIYRFRSQQAAFDTGALRFRTWRFVAEEVWLPRPLLGAGPGVHTDLTELELGVSSAHNGVLLNLAEVGAVGTAPLIALVVVAGRNVRFLERKWTPLVAGVLTAGIVESLGERTFFGVGNPATLMFLFVMALSIVSGTTPNRHVTVEL